jgi:hypothetical protein
MWRRGTNRYTASIASRISIPHVVDQQPNDVGAFPFRFPERIQLSLNLLGLLRMRNRRLHVLDRSHRSIKRRLGFRATSAKHPTEKDQHKNPTSRHGSLPSRSAKEESKK